MRKLLLTIFLQLLIGGLVKAQSPAHEMANRLGTGYNFGNVMSANNEGDWAAPIEEYMMEDVANAGFDHIRLPVRWGSHTDENAPYTIDPAWLTRVEQVVDWALERNLIVVLNAHGEHWFIEEVHKEDNEYPDPEKWERMVKIWEQIGSHFKGKSHDVVFELLNEPYFNMNKKLVDEINIDLLAAVRKEHPDRIVMLTGGGDNAIHAPQQMDLSIFENDNKIIPWFHYYWPNTFSKYPEINGSSPIWGTKEEYASLYADFKNVKDWADTNNLPLYLGEFGSNSVCDAKSRERYHKAIIETSEALDFPRAIWCAGPKSNKMIYTRNQGEWVDGQLEALFPSSKRKNILFLVVDDLNTDLVAFNNSEVQTPVIDKLAEEGIKYLNAQCSYPVCGPSRASFLTGTYPERNGVTNLSNLLPDIAPDLTTLPELLSKNGYRTAAVGKVFDPRNVDDGHYNAAWTEDYTAPSKYIYPEEYGDFVGGNSYRVTDGTSYEIGPEGVGDDGYQDGQFSEHAVATLEELGASSQPFFLAVGFKKPHLPFVAPKKYFDLYDRNTLTLADYQTLPQGAPSFIYKEPTELTGYNDIPQTWEAIYNGHENVLDPEKQRELLHAYYACASYIDAQIGKVITKLEEIGEKENTLIILISDHGFNLGDHNMWGKHNLLQNAVQVPMIVIDPAKALKNEKDRAVQLVDLYPTVCDYTSTPKPSFLQGNSLYIADDTETNYPLDLAVTFYKKNGSNGYTFKQGKYRYTMWTSDKTMTPMEQPFSVVTTIEEEFYVYQNNQEIETENVINKAAYSKEIAVLKEAAEKWWTAYYGQVHNLESTNLIRINSNFEEGVLTGWTSTFKSGSTIDYDFVSENHPVNGTKAGVFHIRETGTNVSNIGLRSNEYAIGYTTNEIEDFEVAFDIYTTTATTIRYQLQFDGNTEKVISDNIEIEAGKDIKINTKHEVPIGVSSVRILFQLGTATERVYFDNVSIKIDGLENDKELLKEAVDNLEIIYQGEDSKNAVSNNLILPQESTNATTVTWVSDTPNAVLVQNDTGYVFLNEEAITVKLTATITLKNLTEVKEFVVKLNPNVSPEMIAALDNLEIQYSYGDNAENVTKDIYVSGTSLTAKVDWVSNNSGVTFSDFTGVVSQVTEDVQGTIEARLSIGNEKAIKLFLLNVKAKEETPTTTLPSFENPVLYPNPTSSLLYIKGIIKQGATASLYSLEGKKLGEYSLAINGARIDLSSMKKGIYLLLIEGKSYKIIRK
ncbi:sulfatase-like hydrolase/transferase [Flammeovirga kamogawensis]|uniref:Sulfatase-like hydrolase/transferase n=1 Tax=Flammeovirga kamogawensis TaxID=373891 RepID=A0ABX8H2X3_9BACT|nr:sulfatase-like hydrolase/transferase [Flammeovirga kamogawensis]MBB6462387.1 arylsulfatase A-like enzyme/aryl-phospho-beta-D-glucosidase BglC (GH1 family) [Flammeovirga kamogawensis]QWG09500.1 sulfatase-like hydrolase/transferase [Flammeovirga kamogawensis]TRX65016.1 sulfatase-like hydrolase/transferase [Flammeovirga kamogawensis]